MACLWHCLSPSLSQKFPSTVCTIQLQPHQSFQVTPSITYFFLWLSPRNFLIHIIYVRLSFLDGKHVFELHGFQPCVLTFLEVVLSLQTSHFFGIWGELIGRQSYIQFLQLGISLLHHVTLVVLSQNLVYFNILVPNDFVVFVLQKAEGTGEHGILCQNNR